MASYPAWASTLLNKYVTNRLFRRLVKLSVGPFAIIQHVGRRSGQCHETVLWVWPLGNGFVIALTYGKGDGAHSNPDGICHVVCFSLN